MATSEQRELDEFISLVSHDLRTPLTAIKGYAQLVLRQRRGQPDDSITESLRTIVEQSDRLDEMTAALLDISRVRVGRVPLRLESVDFVSVAERTLAQLPSGAAQLDRGSTTDLPVSADPARIAQIIRTVATFLAQRDGAGVITARLIQDSGRACLEIDDDGAALEPAARAELFDRLIEPALDRPTGWRIARPELYIARGLAVADGGSLGVESPAGGADQGVRIALTLPLQRD